MCHTFLSKSSESEKNLNKQSLAYPPKTQNLIQAVSVGPLDYLEEQVKKLSRAALSAMNSLFFYDNKFKCLAMSQKRIAVKSGISRERFNKLLPFLEAQGFVIVERRDTYETCIYKLPILFKDKHVRARLSKYFPALIVLPMAFLYSSFHPERILEKAKSNFASECYVTPIIKDDANQYYKTNKHTERDEKTHSSPPTKVDSLSNITTKTQNSQQRVREDFVLPADSPWNIPYPWKTT